MNNCSSNVAASYVTEAVEKIFDEGSSYLKDSSNIEDLSLYCLETIKTLVYDKISSSDAPENLKGIEEINADLRLSLELFCYSYSLQDAATIQLLNTFDIYSKPENWAQIDSQRSNSNNSEEEVGNSTSSFLNPLFNGIEAYQERFVNEVKKELTERVLWDKKNLKLITDIATVHKNLNEYFKDQMQILTGDELSRDLQYTDFLKRLELSGQEDLLSLTDPKNNANAPQIIKAAFSGENTFGLDQSTVSAFLKLSYFDNLIDLCLGGFLTVNPQYKYKNTLKSSGVYSYSSKANITFADNDEQIDISKNTESLIKLLISSMSLYNYATGEVSGEGISLEFWKLSINLLKEVANNFQNIMNKQEREVEVKNFSLNKYTQLLSNKLTESEFKWIKDKCLSNPKCTLGDLVNMAPEAPGVCYKAFLTVLFENKNEDLIKALQSQTAESNSFISYKKDVTDTEINLLYSLYKNVFEESDNAISLSYCNKNSAPNLFSNTPNLYNCILQEIVTSGKVKMGGYIMENGVLTKIEFAKKNEYAQRRSLERALNDSFREISYDSFEDYMEALVPNIKCEVLKDFAVKVFPRLKITFPNNEVFMYTPSDKSVEFTKNGKPLSDLEFTNLFQSPEFLNLCFKFLPAIDIRYNNELKEITLNKGQQSQYIALLGSMISSVYDYFDAKKDSRVLVKRSASNNFSNKSFKSDPESRQWNIIANSDLAELNAIALDIIKSNNQGLRSANKDATGKTVSDAVLSNKLANLKVNPTKAKILYPDSPINKFSLYKNNLFLDVLTNRDIENSLHQTKKITEMSTSEMFASSFIGDYLSMYADKLNWSKSIYNGRRVGVLAGVFADKPAISNIIMDGEEQALPIYNQNGEQAGATSIKDASINDLKNAIYFELGGYYKQMLTAINNNYKKLLNTELAGVLPKWSEDPLENYKEYSKFVKKNESAVFEACKIYNQDHPLDIIEFTELIDTKFNDSLEHELNKYSNPEIFNLVYQLHKTSFLVSLLKKNVQIDATETVKHKSSGKDKDLLDGISWINKTYPGWNNGLVAQSISLEEALESGESYIIYKDAFGNTLYFHTNSIYLEVASKDAAIKNKKVADIVTPDGKIIPISHDAFYQCVKGTYNPNGKLALAKIEYLDSTGSLHVAKITNRTEFMDLLKYMPTGNTVLKNPLALLNTALGCKITLHPELEKYNNLSTFAQQEQILSLVGSCISHPDKGIPSLSSFFKDYFSHQKALPTKYSEAINTIVETLNEIQPLNPIKLDSENIESDIIDKGYNLILNGVTLPYNLNNFILGYKESKLSYREKALEKRNVIFTAQKKQVLLDLINGLPNKIKYSLLKDINTKCYTPAGDMGKATPFDGATFMHPAMDMLINNSLNAAKVGTDIKGFSSFYDFKRGIGGIMKTANFAITNELMRKNNFYKTMFFNMSKHRWKDENGNDWLPNTVSATHETPNKYGIFTSPNSSADNATNLLLDSYFYKVNDKYFSRQFVNYDAKSNTYNFVDLEVDEFGGTTLDAEPLNVPITIEDNYTLFDALGGWNSVSRDETGKLVYSEWSRKKLGELMISTIIKPKDLNYKDILYKHQIYQPLLNSDILLAITEGAAKFGGQNMNPTSCYTEDIYDDNKVIKKRSNWNFAYMNADDLGPQLDKEHHADDSEIANMTLVISAAASRGFTPNEVEELYNSLACISTIQTQEFRKEDGFVEALTQDTINTYKNIIYKAVCDYLLYSQNTDGILSVLANNAIKSLKEKNLLFDQSIYTKCDQAIPLSHPSIYNKVMSIISTTLTKTGIKTRVGGTLSVLNPAHSIIKFYNTPKKEIKDKTNFIEAWNTYKDQVQDFDTDVNSRKIFFNYLADLEDIPNNINIALLNEKISEIQNSGEETPLTDREDSIILSNDVLFKKVQANELPIFGDTSKNISTLFSSEKFLDILDELEDANISVQDIEIGQNYKIHYSPDNLDIIKDRIKQAILKDPSANIDKLIDANGNFWFNVMLPNNTIYDAHAGGSLLLKNILRDPVLSGLVTVSKLNSKGSDLKSYNAKGTFKTADGEEKAFALDDLDSVQELCALKSLKPNNYYGILNQSVNYFKRIGKVEEIENFLNFQTENVIAGYSNFTADKKLLDSLEALSGKDIDSDIDSNQPKELTLYGHCNNFIIQLLKSKKNLSITRQSLEKYIAKNMPSFYKDYPNVVEALLNTYEKYISNLSVKLVEKIYQDDLFRLSEDNTLKVDGTTYINNQPGVIDPKSVKIQKFGVIMPKVSASTLGLPKNCQPEDVKNDPDYFYKLIKLNLKCTVPSYITRQESDAENKSYEERRTEVWDLEFKRLDGKHVYLKKNMPNVGGLQKNKSYYKYQNEKTKKWELKDYKTNETVYHLADENDEVYLLQNGSDLIVSQVDSFKHYLDEVDHVSFSINPNINNDENYNLIDLALSNSKESSTWEVIKQVSENNKDVILQNIMPVFKDPDTASEENLKQYYKFQDNSIKFKAKTLRNSFLHSLNIIAARIPAQCLQSVMPMEVEGFVDEDLNKAMVSIYQFFLQGSDLDIDAVSLQTYTFNKDGSYPSVSYYTDISSEEMAKASEMLPLTKNTKPRVASPDGISIDRLLEGYSSQISKTVVNTLELELNNNSFSLWNYYYSLAERENDPDGEKVSLYISYMQAAKEQYLLSNPPIMSKDGKHEAGLLTYLKATGNVGLSNEIQQHFKEVITKGDTIYQGFDENLPFVIITDKNNYKHIRLNVQTPERMKRFAEFLKDFDTKVVKEEASNSKNKYLVDEFLEIVNNHYTWLDPFKKNKKYIDAAYKNHELAALHSITSNPAHWYESISAIDVITEPVKNLASTSEAANDLALAYVGNSCAQFEGIETNMAGKTGIATCATAEKTFFALSAAVQFALRGNDPELKKTLLYGLPQISTNNKLVENKNFDGLIAGKRTNLLANAMEPEFYNKFIESNPPGAWQNYVELLKSDLTLQDNIDNLLGVLINQYRYSSDAALVISALLSLATDNAKELVLNKINAGPETMDLYLAGATMGYSIEELYLIINSKYGLEITRFMKSDILTGKSKYLSAAQAIKNFEDLFKLLETNYKTRYPLNSFARLPIDAVKETLAYEVCQELNIFPIVRLIKLLNPNKLTDTLKKILATYESALKDPIRTYMTNAQVSGPYFERKTKMIENLRLRIHLARMSSNSTIKDLALGKLVTYNNEVIAYAHPKAKSSPSEKFHAYIRLYENEVHKMYDSLDEALLAMETKYANTTLYNIYGKYDNTVAFEKLAKAADEFKRAGGLLSVNKEVKSLESENRALYDKFVNVFDTLIKLLESVKGMPELVLNVHPTKNNNEALRRELLYKPIQFKDGEPIRDSGILLDVERFVNDATYRRDCINFYDKIKTYINVLLPFEVDNHWILYLNTLVILHNCKDSTLHSLLASHIAKTFITKHKVRETVYKEQVYNNVKQVSQYLMIQKFLNNPENIKLNYVPTKDFQGVDSNLNPISIKAKEFKGGNKSKDLFDLKTAAGKINFIHYMNQEIIPYVMGRFSKDNSFLQLLMFRQITSKISGHNILHYAPALENMMPKTSEEQAKIILNRINLDFKKLANNLTSEEQEDIKKNLGIISQESSRGITYDANVNIADLFFIYGLLTTGANPGPTSIMLAMSSYSAEPYSIANAFYKFLAAEESKLVSEYYNYYDKLNNVFKLTPDHKDSEIKLLIDYIEFYKEDEISPIAKINDPGSAGNLFRIKDLNSGNLYKITTKDPEKKLRLSEDDIEMLENMDYDENDFYSDDAEAFDYFDDDGENSESTHKSFSYDPLTQTVYLSSNNSKYSNRLYGSVSDIKFTLTSNNTPVPYEDKGNSIVINAEGYAPLEFNASNFNISQIDNIFEQIEDRRKDFQSLSKKEKSELKKKLTSILKCGSENNTLNPEIATSAISTFLTSSIEDIKNNLNGCN